MGIIHYNNVCEITGDIPKIATPEMERVDTIFMPRLGDLALMSHPSGAREHKLPT